MDRRTVVAIALCLLVLILYPSLLRWAGLGRYLPQRAPAPTATVDSLGQPTTPLGSAPPARDTIPTGAGAAPAPREPQLSAAPLRGDSAALERLWVVETPLYRATFTNRGARLVSTELKHYASAHGPSERRGRIPRPRKGEPVPAEDRVVLAGGPSFGLDLGSGAALRSLDGVTYQAAESLDAAGTVRALTFTARLAGGASVRQTWRVDPERYALDLEVELHGIPADWRLSDYSLTARSWPLIHEQNVTDEVRSLRATCLVGSNLHRQPVGALRKGPRILEGNVLWAAVQTRYFSGIAAVTQGATKAVISRADARRLTPELRQLLPPDERPEQDVAINSLVVALPGELSPTHRFLVYFGPNEYFGLARLGNGMERLVDLGWTWIVPFSKTLLRLLVWFHALLHNYGVAIILLATLVRLVMHPLSMMSMKSMRAMHRLQPEMERVREKHKNDPQAMNTAVMALYREHKVNPAGGCLPMLLQMPVFIALYSVLYNAIELRQAPFVGWIDDLSSPDLLFHVGPIPVRLLPLLMTGSGLLMQKLTPTDPRQLTTMYMMNVVMLVFFYNLPSGLVLYWTVMNLLSALQQWLALRGDEVPAAMPEPARTIGPSPGGARARPGKVVRKATSK
jgi:YidC/Oxa1 family membrane protein insertase